MKPALLERPTPANPALASVPVPISTIARWQGRSRKAVYTELTTHVIPAGVFWRHNGRIFVDPAKYAAWLKGELRDSGN